MMKYETGVRKHMEDDNGIPTWTIVYNKKSKLDVYTFYREEDATYFALVWGQYIS